MAIRYSIESHAIGFPSKVLAANGGKHIYNVKLTSDTDNGNFVGRGDWLALDLYEETAATTFEGIVREVAANGNYYVEVVDPGDALFVAMPVIIEEEWTNTFKKDSNFFNAKGDVVNGYELAVGDILEISEAGFTAKPALVDGVDYKVELSGKKLAKA